MQNNGFKLQVGRFWLTDWNQFQEKWCASLIACICLNFFNLSYCTEQDIGLDGRSLPVLYEHNPRKKKMAHIGTVLESIRVFHDQVWTQIATG